MRFKSPTDMKVPNTIVKMFVFLALFNICTPIVNAGFLDGAVDTVKKGGKKLEKGYQNLTEPARAFSNGVYKKTIRKPFNEAKRSFNDAIPDHAKYLYKRHFERRFRPLLDYSWNVPTGCKTLSEGTNDILNEYFDQAKELFIFPELYATYESALAVSSPIPKDMLSEIEKYWSKVSGRTLQKEARFITSKELVLALTLREGIEAVTLFDLIIFRDPLSNSCSSHGLLAHELIHVDQFHQDGFAGFAAKYYIGGKLQFDDDNPMEEEAYGVGKSIENLLGPSTPTLMYHTKRPEIGPWQENHVISWVARMESTDSSSDHALQVALGDAMQRNDQEGILNLSHFAIANPSDRFSKQSQAAACRLIASGRSGVQLAPCELQQWAMLAVQYEQDFNIDWYWLYLRSIQCGDIKTSYNALIVLAAKMIEEEVQKGTNGQMTQRLIDAQLYLHEAARLGAQIAWNQQTMLFDNRLPFILLASIGLELKPTFMTDNSIVEYANGARQIDTRMQSKDRYHFELLNIYSQVFLRIGLKTKSLNHMKECINCCNMAMAEFKQVGGNVAGISPNYFNEMKSRSRYAQNELR